MVLTSSAEIRANEYAFDLIVKLLTNQSDPARLTRLSALYPESYLHASLHVEWRKYHAKKNVQTQKQKKLPKGKPNKIKERSTRINAWRPPPIK